MQKYSKYVIEVHKYLVKKLNCLMYVYIKVDDNPSGIRLCSIEIDKDEFFEIIKEFFNKYFLKP